MEKDMMRSDVMAYLIEKGANKAEADRWSQTKVKPCKRKTYENGMGSKVTSSFYACSDVYAISEKEILAWREADKAAVKERRIRNAQKKKELKAELASLPTAPVIVLDTETTGTKAYDEILELAIVSEDGKTLFHEYFRPDKKKSWDRAASINGIYPQDVEKECSIKTYHEVIQRILDAADFVVGYNVEFDLGMLQHAGFPCKAEPVDVMKIFSEWQQTKKWRRLTACAEACGYDWGKTSAHGALADTLATRFCWQKLKEWMDSKKDVPERNGEIEMLKERIAVLEKVFGSSNRAC